ncbi:hypothetical protein AB6A40_003294 [Gnathostoma spinigerum]|uniref:EF-hand domain-containing protein n=1 Tax=Gnathostoma spinigerum TaxID=75299 RepID=A0ABD6EAB9_9BILA
MGQSNVIPLSPSEMADLIRTTGFHKSQIKRLYNRFASLDREGKGYLDRDDLLRVPELSLNPLGDRIVAAFFNDLADTEKMSFSDFITVLSQFRPVRPGMTTSLNDRTHKLKFAFAMYDLNKNGYITRLEFRLILQLMIGQEDKVTREEMDGITDLILHEADMKKDGQLSFEEFCQAMQKVDIENLMAIQFSRR